MIVGNVADNLFMGGSARYSGASWLSIGIALVAGVAGSILFPPVGGLIAALIGIFIVELVRLKDLRHAWKSLRSMATGCGWAFFRTFCPGFNYDSSGGLFGFSCYSRFNNIITKNGPLIFPQGRPPVHPLSRLMHNHGVYRFHQAQKARYRWSQLDDYLELPRKEVPLGATLPFQPERQGVRPEHKRDLGVRLLERSI